jgi:hypothetical protein
MTSKVYVALRVKATPERAFAVFTEEIGAGGAEQAVPDHAPRAGPAGVRAGEGGG